MELPEHQIFLYFDDSLMEKVFFNLLSNAFKVSSPGGQVGLRLIEDKSPSEKSLETLEPGHEWIGIEVSDTGPGLSREQIEKIFERFLTENN